METVTFISSENFLDWARRIVKFKYQKYDRVPIGRQVWTYGDGHVAETEMGKNGGTLFATLAFKIKTASGELKHSSDAQLVSDIDTVGASP